MPESSLKNPIIPQSRNNSTSEHAKLIMVLSRISSSSSPLVHRITLDDIDSEQIADDLNKAWEGISASDVLAGLHSVYLEYGPWEVRYVGGNQFHIEKPENWRK
jgi:hypothetical protein